MIRCPGQGHRVGIDPARFWRPARCPACHATLDPFRIRRLWWWLTGKAPRSRLRVGRLGQFTPIDGGIILLAIGLAVVAALIRWTGDRWWVGTVVLFSGRWPWLVPGVPLALAAVASRRLRSVALLALPAFIGVFGVLGVSIGIGRLGGGGVPGSRIRIITYNVGGGDRVAAHLTRLLEDWQPDLVTMQECGLELKAALEKVRGYHLDFGPVCLLSRFPIQSVSPLPRKAVEDVGGSGQVFRYRLAAPAGEFDFTTVHLDTPRWGFEALLRGDLGAVSLIRRGILLREIESRQARRWVDEGPGPRLVAGDFNLPLESGIFRDYWGDLTETYSAAGFGFGATRLNGWIRLRIDHVLSDDGWVVRAAKVLPDYGSDHRPLMADVERRR